MSSTNLVHKRGRPLATFLTGLAAALLATPAVTDQAPDMAGPWQMDTGKSQVLDGRTMTLTIETVARKLKLSSTVRERIRTNLETTLVFIRFCQAFAQVPASDLTNSSSRLLKSQGRNDNTVTPDDKSKYTTDYSSDGQVSGSIDSNRQRVTWKSTGPNQIQLGSMALNTAICPLATLNDNIPRDWQYVRPYTFRDGHLFLSLMAEAGKDAFEPVNQWHPISGNMSGTAPYRERMALPPNAVFEAILEDVSRSDATAEVIGQIPVEGPRYHPIAFEITYDLSRINTSYRYAVRSRTLVDDKLGFTTNQDYPVLTAGRGNEFALFLPHVHDSTPVEGGVQGAANQSTPTGAGASLENTYWKLIRLGDTPLPGTSEQQRIHFVLHSQNRRVSGSGGCNSLTGSYELRGDQLKFSQMVSTMTACLEGMNTEKAFLDALKKVNRWKLTGKKLDLLDANGHRLAQLEAHYSEHFVK